MSSNFPTNNYGPSGYNDNNFNRSRMPSNQYPPNGGMLGNPFGRFNQLSTNEMQMMKNLPSMSNFNDSFAKNDPMIEPLNYTNQNELLHNNVADQVLDEHVVEYRLDIDSLDRDIKTYPNQFNFTIHFAPQPGGTVRTEIIQNGQTKTVNDRFQGAPKPHITKEFRNVKYVKLDSIVLPQYSDLKREDDEYVVDEDSYLVDDRFVALGIKELTDSDIRIYSTSDDSVRVTQNGNILTPSRNFATIFPDKRLGKFYYVGTPYNGSKIYNNSLLGNIKKLTIQFYDSCGEQLKFSNMFSFNDLIQAEKQGCPLPLDDLRHPLNKKTQVYLSLIVGVVESQVNTNTQFER
jgi:hypothetical protein